MAVRAQGRGRREVDVLFRDDLLVMAFPAEVGHGRGQQLDGVRGVGIVAGGAFPRDSGLVLVPPQEQSPIMTVIAEVGLFGLERQHGLVLARMGRNMAGAASLLQGRVQDPALAHGLVAFVAVLIGRMGGAGARQHPEGGEEEK